MSNVRRRVKVALFSYLITVTTRRSRQRRCSVSAYRSIHQFSKSRVFGCILAFIQQAESLVSFHVVPSCFRGSLRLLEFRRTWFLEALSCDWQSLFCVRDGKLFVSHCYNFEVVLNAFRWYLGNSGF